MALYLGIDLSTQSISAIGIEVDPLDASLATGRDVVFECSLPFDEILPSYGTESGVLPSDDPTVAHSSPLMWVESIEKLFEALASEGADLSKVRAIAVSGQQHGSVYLNDRADAVLAGLDPDSPLVDQFRGVFSRSTSPIWMDSSSKEACREITGSIGGAAALAELTGSAAFERFTGPQIRKFYQTEPEAYADTNRIHLVSSFVATVLAGTQAPIDPGDGAGMNLMDLKKKDWSIRALGATAPGLRGKLPPISESFTAVGRIAPYFSKRFGFCAETLIVPGTGDNPASLIGVGLVKSGRIALSLGTSDTLFGFMPQPRVDPEGEGHVFGAPTGHYMSLICFKNGSLAREKVRDRFSLDWDGFNRVMGEEPAGNRGRVLLPWFDPEITPRVLEAGPRLYGLDWDSSGPGAFARAVVEAQMAAMAIHSEWMGVDTETIYATGGASANREILQIMADVHGAEVYPFEVGKSAALGAALRAWHAERLDSGESPQWEDIVRGFAEPLEASRVSPDRTRGETYRRFRELYRASEDHALRGGPDPTALRESWEN